MIIHIDPNDGKQDHLNVGLNSTLTWLIALEDFSKFNGSIFLIFLILN
jgi:hypothetical protein